MDDPTNDRPRSAEEINRMNWKIQLAAKVRDTVEGRRIPDVKRTKRKR